MNYNCEQSMVPGAAAAAATIALLALAIPSYGAEPATPSKSTSTSKSSKSGQSNKITCEQVNSGCNIFSDADSESPACPGFRQPTDPKGKIRRLINIENNKFPTMAQIGQTPGLTGKQRKEIEQIYNATKEVVEPWIKELRDKRQKPQADGRMFDERNPAQDLLERIRQKRLEAWTQVKTILTEQQVDQLEQMRRGEMFTGLNAPMAPPEMHKAGKFDAPAVMAPPPGTTIAPVDPN
jgi:hypothetical protein